MPLSYPLIFKITDIGKTILYAVTALPPIIKKNPVYSQKYEKGAVSPIIKKF